MENNEKICLECGGSGRITLLVTSRACDRCGGTGRVAVSDVGQVAYYSYSYSENEEKKSNGDGEGFEANILKYDMDDKGDLRDAVCVRVIYDADGRVIRHEFIG